jgi:hypothetical protein
MTTSALASDERVLRLLATSSCIIILLWQQDDDNDEDDNLLVVTFSGSHQSTNLPTTTFRIIGVCVRLSIINKPDVFASNNATGVTYSWRFDCTLIRLEEVSHQ